MNGTTIPPFKIAIDYISIDPQSTNQREEKIPETELICYIDLRTLRSLRVVFL